MLVTAIFAHGDAVDLIGVNGARRHDGEVVPEVAVIGAVGYAQIDGSAGVGDEQKCGVEVIENVSAVTPGVGRLLSVAVTVMS